MIFEGLADRLQETFKKLRGHGRLTEDDKYNWKNN